jgi:hypothetical protein
MLTRLIWTTSAQHSVVNYPSNYYGSYTPNMPTKLYHDPRVKEENFNVLNLPGKVTAAVSHVRVRFFLFRLSIDPRFRSLSYFDLSIFLPLFTGPVFLFILHVCLSVCLLSTCLSVYMSVCLSVCLSTCLSVCLLPVSVGRSVCPSCYPSVIYQTIRLHFNLVSFRSSLLLV